jgi:hypothetical protein
VPSEDLTHWVDDLYDMDEAELRGEVERYARLARKYDYSPDKPAHKWAFLRHREALTILEGRAS